MQKKDRERNLSHRENKSLEKNERAQQSCRERERERERKERNKRVCVYVCVFSEHKVDARRNRDDEEPGAVYGGGGEPEARGRAWR